MADSLSLVRFDTNDYSVPTEYRPPQVTVVATVDEVRMVCEDRVVAEHRRCWGREQIFYEPIHYLAVLERKPGAWTSPAPGELGAAGLLRAPAAPAGGGPAAYGHAGVHQGAATAGEGRPRRS